jgi:hypothetical protein
MATEFDAATRFVEQLLSDAALRTRFRRDPAGVLREAGLDQVAETFEADPDGWLQALEPRESRSNLAGALMAAAVEGIGLSGHGSEALHGSGGAPGAHAARLADSAEVGARAQAPIDPDQFGQQGTGGPPTPEDKALLHNDNVVLDANGIADVNGGRLDPRVIAVITDVSREHKITISSTSSDHPRLTAGGSVSNHTVGRAFDIATIDGEPVGPGSAVARRVALELSRLPASIRPSEIGSPWALPGAAYFTDAAHQNHLHVGFDDPIEPSWKPPAALAARDGNGGAAAPLVAAAPADGAAVDPSYGAAAGSSFSPDDPGLDDGSDDDDESDDEDDDGLAADGESDDGDVEDDDDDEDEPDEDEPDENEPDEDEDDDGPDFDDGADEDDSGGGEPVAVADPVGGSQPADIDPGIVGGAYPGDGGAPERIAAWMAAQAQQRGLPPELPLMASLVESGMKNLSGGDADSVGFFQMRVGIWNQGPYAGYPQRPDLQLKWFLDTAAAVKRQRLAAGLPIDRGHYGEWIADVERPAAEYRGRYQLRLGEARGLLARARELLDQTSGSGDAPTPGGSATAGRRALAALGWARRELGVPYVYGGETPQGGFDCSGLVQWAYSKVGISIPRTSEEQILAANATPVGRHDLLPGDLVFFRDASGDVHHVGMSLGGDKFLEAPHTGARVRISSLNDSYYAQQFTGGRRFDRTVAAQAPHAERQYLKALDPRQRPA